MWWWRWRESEAAGIFGPKLCEVSLGAAWRQIAVGRKISECYGDVTPIIMLCRRSGKTR